MRIIKILTETAGEAFSACGYSAELGTVGISARPDLCQFQCNGAMQGAKLYKKAPMAIAGEVAAQLSKDLRFSDVSAVAPGFINISLTDGYLSDLVREMAGDDRLGIPLADKIRTIVVDYGGPNVAKPLHIGHLRTAIIGEALYRLAKLTGNRVISDIHLGDWGLQMGLVIAEVKRRIPDLCFFDPDYKGEYPCECPVTADELGEIYPSASARAKTDKAFADDAAQATVELQQGTNPGYRAFWELIREVSVSDAKRNYDRLGVSFDYWYGESGAEPYIPRVIELLKERGLLKPSDGAMIVEVSTPEDSEPMPPVIISKSNGGDVYGTTDLGTLLQRMEDWNPDEIWYVVDSRQSLHFKQVFRAARLAGIIKPDTVCEHISYGTIKGKDGKPLKTRDGGTVRLSDIIETVTDNAYERAVQSGVIEDEAEKRNTARMVGVAALKVADLMNQCTKDYVFDVDRSLSTEGRTGPYLQYTAVRINSVLTKARETEIEAGTLLPPSCASERELMLSLIRVPETTLRAFNEKAPNVICDTLFDIAGTFNKFYNENRIISCPDRNRRASWITLLTFVRRMIGTLLDVLSIEVPEQM